MIITRFNYSGESGLFSIFRFQQNKKQNKEESVEFQFNSIKCIMKPLDYLQNP